MSTLGEQTLQKSAVNGDINAFQKLFSEFQDQLESYLYRLLTDREDAKDITHDTFVRAFNRIETYNDSASLKTWVFTIATNLAYDHLKKYKRWKTDAQDVSKALSQSDPNVFDSLIKAGQGSGEGTYEIKEHIDFCFTCISKTLPIEQQVALLLKNVYDFPVDDICLILEQSKGVVKHLLVNARKSMTKVFDHRCALVNQKGVCNQCSELNAVYNPKQDQQEALMKVELVKSSDKFNKEELYGLREKLVKGIDPLRSKGADLQDVIMKCTRQSIGEISSMD